MGYKNLFIFIEGPDDQRFFERIIKPRFERKYSKVRLLQWANLKKEILEKYIKSFGEEQADYIFVTDIDKKPCPTSKKQQINSLYKTINDHNILVVIKEIESWYLAGLNQTGQTKFQLSVLDSTDNISKGKFEKLMPSKFDSRKDFMVEILKPEYFSLNIAKEKNNSFRYFCDKYLS